VPARPVAGPGDGAFNRIERLEQELVELRAALTDPRLAGSPAAVGPAAAAVAAGRAGSDPTAVVPSANRSAPGAPQAGQPAKVPLWPAQSDQAEPSTVRSPAPLRPAPGPGGAPGVGPAAGQPAATRVAAEHDGGLRTARGTRVMAAPNGGPPSGRPPAELRGVAAVPRPAPPRQDDESGSPEPSGPPPLRPLPGARLDSLRRGMGISVTCALFSFVCWGIWAIANRDASFTGNLMMFVFVLLIAVGLFVLCRLMGRLVIEGMMRRSRASARLSHLAVGAYLIAAGVSFAGQVGWVHMAYEWIASQIR
jgi:hypothetical protein